MAAHFSFLAWEIPWTEEPGGLQSMGLQRVGRDLVTNNTATDLMVPAVSFIKTAPHSGSGDMWHIG